MPDLKNIINCCAFFVINFRMFCDFVAMVFYDTQI